MDARSACAIKRNGRARVDPVEEFYAKNMRIRDAGLGEHAIKRAGHRPVVRRHVSYKRSARRGMHAARAALFDPRNKWSNRRSAGLKPSIESNSLKRRGLWDCTAVEAALVLPSVI